MAAMLSSARKRWIRRIIREYWVFLRDFFRDLFDARLEHYAASLSWSTLFAIVPLLAIMIAVFASMPAFERLRAALERLMRDNLPISDPGRIMGYIDHYIANAGQLGWIGAAYVLIATVLFVRTYDYIVNDICAARPRGALGAARVYGLLALGIPLLAAAAYGLNGWLGDMLTGAGLRVWEWLGGIIPFLLIWAVFWLLYQATPNRPIAPAAAATSAFIAAAVWAASKWLFVIYVAHNRTYSSIYGSVAAVMFFLLWIHLSWAIFIHGLKFCVLLDGGGEVKRI